MERLDQGHLHPKQEVPGLTFPSRESNMGLPGGWRAIYSRKEPFQQLVIIYSKHIHFSPQHGSPQCMWYMNIHENTWIALYDVGWIVLARRIACCLADDLQVRVFRIGVTTRERFDQGHLHPKLEVPGLTCPGRGTSYLDEFLQLLSNFCWSISPPPPIHIKCRKYG